MSGSFTDPVLEDLRQQWEGEECTGLIYASDGLCPVLLALTQDPESQAWQGIRYARIAGTWMASLDFNPARQCDHHFRDAVAWILRAANELAMVESESPAGTGP